MLNRIKSPLLYQLSYRVGRWLHNNLATSIPAAPVATLRHSTDGRAASPHCCEFIQQGSKLCGDHCEPARIRGFGGEELVNERTHPSENLPAPTLLRRPCWHLGPKQPQRFCARLLQRPAPIV